MGPLRLFGWPIRACVLLVLIAPSGTGEEPKAPQYGPEVQKRLDELRQKGEPVTLEDLTPEPIPPEENAATIYRQAFAAYVEPDEAVHILRSRRRWSTEEAEKVRQWLENNRKTLALLHQASLIDQCQFDGPYEPMDEKLHNMPAGLAPALLLNCSILLHVRDDQPRKAIGDCLTGLRVARHFGLRSTFVDFAGQGYMASYSLPPLPKLLSQAGLRDSDYEEVAVVLRDVLQSVSVVRSFQASRVSIIESIVRRGRAPEAEVLAMLDVWDRVFSAAEQPYYEVVDELQELDEHFARSTIPSMITVVASTGHVRLQAWLRTAFLEALVALELEAHRRTTGSYPTDLTDMKLTYLEELPNDPCSGQPFHYEKTSDGYRLYSVGTNARYDGGRAGTVEHDDIGWAVKMKESN